MENKFKGYYTKSIKYENHKEFLKLEDCINGNYMQEGWTLICKMYFEGRLKWE